MKISIVTISLNQAAWLEHAILSVLGQNYQDLEYIIVDPGSTDGSRDIIERYRGRFAHVIYDGDRGPADGLNKGFSRASGDVFAYLNADDLLLPGALAGAAQAFLNFPGDDVIYGHGEKIDGAGNVIGPIRSDRFSLRRAAYGNSIIMQQAAFWRRQAYEAIGGFNFLNRLSWDGEFWIDLALAGKSFRRVNKYWGAFRTHQASITQTFHQSEKFQTERQRLMEKALGRKLTSSDRLATVATHAEKWLVDPVNLLLRIEDSLKRGGR